MKKLKRVLVKVFWKKQILIQKKLIQKNYQIALEKYLKEKFINSFSEILNEKTELTIKIFYEEKAELIERLDDLFSSIEDKDLNEIN